MKMYTLFVIALMLGSAVYDSFCGDKNDVFFYLTASHIYAAAFIIILHIDLKKKKD